MVCPTFTRELTLDIATGVVLWLDEVPWEGGWEECKKGREAASQLTDMAKTNAGVDTQRQGEQYGAENKDIGSLEQTGPGGLGTATSAYLANARADINRNYGNARQTVARNNAQRGFAATPDAAFASGINSANLAQAGAENQAYNNALMLQRENTLAAVNARSGLQNLYDPNHSIQTGLSGAEAQSRMGSLLGDIGKGITTGSSLLTPWRG